MSSYADKKMPNRKRNIASLIGSYSNNLETVTDKSYSTKFNQIVSLNNIVDIYDQVDSN